MERKEAIEVIKKNWPDSSFTMLREALETLIPELKESDGEGIRKALKEYFINSFQNNGVAAICGVHIKDILDWLEKQGNLMKALQISNAEIGELIEKNYYLKEQLEKQSEQKMKTPEESLGIDSVTYNKIVDECIYGEQKPAWSEEDDKKAERIIRLLQEAYDINCINGSIDWLKSIKDRVQPQKQEWRDVDRDILFRTIDNLKFLRDTISIDPKYAINIIDIEREITWLNSLRPQYKYAYNPYKAVVESIAEMCKHYDKASHSGLRDFYDNVKVKCKDAKEYDSLFPQSQWKPSDEQMERLKGTINSLPHQEVLYSLYQDLKKLKE